jgi:hypothetical protein
LWWQRGDRDADGKGNGDGDNGDGGGDGQGNGEGYATTTGIGNAMGGWWDDDSCYMGRQTLEFSKFFYRTFKANKNTIFVWKVGSGSMIF